MCGSTTQHAGLVNVALLLKHAYVHGSIVVKPLWVSNTQVCAPRVGGGTKQVGLVCRMWDEAWAHASTAQYVDIYVDMWKLCKSAPQVGTQVCGWRRVSG